MKISQFLLNLLTTPNTEGTNMSTTDNLTSVVHTRHAVGFQEEAGTIVVAPGLLDVFLTRQMEGREGFIPQRPQISRDIATLGFGVLGLQNLTGTFDFAGMKRLEF